MNKKIVLIILILIFQNIFADDNIVFNTGYSLYTNGDIPSLMLKIGYKKSINKYLEYTPTIFGTFGQNEHPIGSTNAINNAIIEYRASDFYMYDNYWSINSGIEFNINIIQKSILKFSFFTLPNFRYISELNCYEGGTSYSPNEPTILNTRYKLTSGFAFGIGNGIRFGLGRNRKYTLSLVNYLSNIGSPINSIEIGLNY